MKSLIFSTPMVKAILAGHKTMTRRVVKPQPVLTRFGRWHWMDARSLTSSYTLAEEMQSAVSRPFKPGDVLYVRETWATFTGVEGTSGYLYKADPAFDNYEPRDSGWNWRSPMFMPQSAARIFLKVTDVTAERLQDISEDDARREGITDGGCLNCGENEPCGCTNPTPDATQSFIRLWNSIYAKKPEYKWNANPWVWVIAFERTSA